MVVGVEGTGRRGGTAEEAAGRRAGGPPSIAAAAGSTAAAKAAALAASGRGSFPVSTFVVKEAVEAAASAAAAAAAAAAEGIRSLRIAMLRVGAELAEGGNPPAATATIVDATTAADDVLTRDVGRGTAAEEMLLF